MDAKVALQRNTQAICFNPRARDGREKQVQDIC